MWIDVAATGVQAIYRTLTDVVNPRPIAWVTSLDAQGRVNLAPFSFFNYFGSAPPVVIFSPTTRHDGGTKDTLANVRASGEFVVHVATADNAEAVNLTSKELPPGESEVDLAGLTLTPSRLIRTPGIAESPVALECRLIQVLPVGDGPLAANLVIGEVLAIRIDDEVIGPDGRIDPRKLRTVGRLGGSFWSHTDGLFSLERP